jgi:hypothetical protein
VIFVKFRHFQISKYLGAAGKGFYSAAEKGFYSSGGQLKEYVGLSIDVWISETQFIQYNSTVVKERGWVKRFYSSGGQMNTLAQVPMKLLYTI